MEKIILILTNLLLLNSCNSSDRRNRLPVTIKVVDLKTRQPRIKDTVEVRMEAWGFPMKRIPVVKRYLTDSNGIVSLRINREKYYKFFSIGSANAWGSEDFPKGGLNVNQQILIKVEK
ncbi:hypothetical protein [Elizabethkingia anophelis]|uniref:hypothetical protein n=1 Tax=Elizabethkingia anophelis TaxID=1117645 RepID=UPI003786FDB8